jgi:hypothetical protein
VLSSRRSAAGPGWLRASRADAHGGPCRARTRWWGPQWSSGPADTGHRRAGPGCGMRAVLCSISGGTRRSPHHRCPKLSHGTSIVKERRPSACVAGPSRDTHSSSGLGGRHSFMGTWGPRECRGRDCMRSSGLASLQRSRPLPPRSAQHHVSTTGPTATRPRAAGDSPASDFRQRAYRSA